MSWAQQLSLLGPPLLPVGGVSEGWRSELRPFVFFAPSESMLAHGVTPAKESVCVSPTIHRRVCATGPPGEKEDMVRTQENPKTKTQRYTIKLLR
jgi:hypothetical protein